MLIYFKNQILLIDKIKYKKICKLNNKEIYSRNTKAVILEKRYRMLNCILLTIILLIMLIINYIFFKKCIIEPAFIFNFSFFVSSFVLTFASAKWNVDINNLTILTIVFSIAFFSITCYGIKYIFRKKIAIKQNNINIGKKIELIKIKKWVLVSFLLFALVMIALTIFYTVKAVDGSFSDIGAALYKYRNYALRYKYDLNFPYIVDLLGGIVRASSYYFMFILINNFIISKKIDILLFLVTTVTSLSTVLDGTRGEIINICLSAIPIFLILYNFHNGKTFKISKKIALLLTLIAIIFITQFQKTAFILGRDDAKAFDTVDYIYIYLGAPIYNLNTFLNNGILDEKYIGIHTFSSVYDIFGDFKTVNKQTFQNLNGNNLGNVYTILFDFICDGKVIGLIIGLFIMALISQALFEVIYNVKKKRKKSNKPNITILVYAYIFGGLFFAFFGNKFYSQIFNLGFVKYIILWCLLNYILFSRKKWLKWLQY